MRRFALILALAPGPVAAEDWVAMTGDEIRAALTGHKLVYKNATQDFRATGETHYNFGGRDSWGNWRIEDDAYCSQWPPNDMWACYTMDRQGERLRFVGVRNPDDITEAVYAD